MVIIDPSRKVLLVVGFAILHSIGEIEESLEKDG